MCPSPCDSNFSAIQTCRRRSNAWHLNIRPHQEYKLHQNVIKRRWWHARHPPRPPSQQQPHKLLCAKQNFSFFRIISFASAPKALTDPRSRPFLPLIDYTLGELLNEKRNFIFSHRHFPSMTWRMKALWVMHDYGFRRVAGEEERKEKFEGAGVKMDEKEKEKKLLLPLSGFRVWYQPALEALARHLIGHLHL